MNLVDFKTEKRLRTVFWKRNEHMKFCMVWFINSGNNALIFYCQITIFLIFNINHKGLWWQSHSNCQPKNKKIKIFALSANTQTYSHEPAISAWVNSDPPWRPGTGGRGSVEPASLSPSLGMDLHSYPSHPPDEPSPLHTASVKRVSTHKHSRWPKQNYSDPNSPSPTATEANIYEFQTTLKQFSISGNKNRNFRLKSKH